MTSMLDLYSGLGGASEAFIEAGCHVIRVDNNPDLDVRNTVHADASYAFNLVSDEKFDLIWASPPCLEFSRAFSAPAPTALREGRPFSPDLRDVHKAHEIIKWLKPRYWVIENVAGSIRHLEPILGEPSQIIGSFVLWHNLPRIVVARDFKHNKADIDPGQHDPLRSNKRAKIPIEISRAVLEAVRLPTLENWNNE